MRQCLMCLILISLCAHPAYAQDTLDYGRYHALLFGNNDYEHLVDLKTAIFDVEELGEVLMQKYGFEVTLHRNANRETILNAFNQMTEELTEKDNLLIYYAGHGLWDELTNTGYWLPVDAQPKSDIYWIPSTDITRYLNRMNAKHVLVIADSCYAGALLLRDGLAHLSAGEETAAWLRRMVEKGSRTAMTSGWLEPVQDSGDGEHSVFAGILLDIIRENNEILDGQGLYYRLKRLVVIKAVSNQIPQYADIKSSKHDGGDFLLVPINLRNSLVNIEPRDLPDSIFREEDKVDIKIPNPLLSLDKKQKEEIRGETFIRYYLSVLNRNAFPEELFKPAPDLPPCDNNLDASRTWVDIYSADDDSKLNGFCDLSSAEALRELWFVVEDGKNAPTAVYAVIKDRRLRRTYQSNPVNLVQVLPVPNNLRVISVD